MVRRPEKPLEFRRIERFLAPLASRLPGACGLKDDAAALTVTQGQELIVTTDTIVATVHFMGDEPAGDIAAKLLRVSLSDLASMGAKPLCYTLNLALSAGTPDDWLEAFCAGLAAEQERFAIALAGGDTVATPGPMTLTCTMFGETPSGMALRRNRAVAGETVYVSGTIGDGALGLLAVRGEVTLADAALQQSLVECYRRPEPRVVLGQGLVGLASAAVDISDGLVGDLAHVADASGVQITIMLESVPLSQAASEALQADPELLATVLTGGDDYEIAFTAPEPNQGQIMATARAAGLDISPIGRVEAGSGVQVIASDGRPLDLDHLGYSHG